MAFYGRKIMKKDLLSAAIAILTVTTIANANATCTSTPDCKSMGYIYTVEECSGSYIACPFDTSKVFCFDPCLYTLKADNCPASQGKKPGAQSCIRNGTVYYANCENLCDTFETYINGTCVPTVCCDNTSTSEYIDSGYSLCRNVYNYPDCTYLFASCRNAGGTVKYSHCMSPGMARFNCEK